VEWPGQVKGKRQQFNIGGTYSQPFKHLNMSIEIYYTKAYDTYGLFAKILSFGELKDNLSDPCVYPLKYAIQRFRPRAVYSRKYHDLGI